MTDRADPAALRARLRELSAKWRDDAHKCETRFGAWILRAADELDALLSEGGEATPAAPALETICRKCGAIADIAARYDPPAVDQEEEGGS